MREGGVGRILGQRRLGAILVHQVHRVHKVPVAEVHGAPVLREGGGPDVHGIAGRNATGPVGVIGYDHRPARARGVLHQRQLLGPHVGEDHLLGSHWGVGPGAAHSQRGGGGRGSGGRDCGGGGRYAVRAARRGARLAVGGLHHRRHHARSTVRPVGELVPVRCADARGHVDVVDELPGRNRRREHQKRFVARQHHPHELRLGRGQRRDHGDHGGDGVQRVDHLAQLAVHVRLVGVPGEHNHARVCYARSSAHPAGARRRRPSAVHPLHGQVSQAHPVRTAAVWQQDARTIGVDPKGLHPLLALANVRIRLRRKGVPVPRDRQPPHAAQVVKEYAILVVGQHGVERPLRQVRLRAHLRGSV